MKQYFLLAALALTAGCASTTETTEVVAPVEETSSIIPGSQADLEQYADHRVYFGYDQHNLTPAAQSVLRKQAEWLLDNPGVTVRLEGNCDERGTREYNLALGARRSQAAKDFLMSLGVDGDRLVTVSNGKEKPIALGSTESAWSQNRNSTTLVVGGASS